MKMKFVFLICLVATFSNRVSALLEDNLQKSIGKAIETAIEQASIEVEGETLLSDKTNKECSISANITCKINSTGQNCKDYVVPMNQCGEEDMTFTFQYCNQESLSPIKLFGGRTTNVDMKNLPKGTMAYINEASVDIILQDLLPGNCWKVVETRKVNTCRKMINSSLKIEGWRGDARKGDYCFAWSFYRSFIKRAQTLTPCAIEGQVSCQRTSTGEDCDEVVIPLQDCGKEEMTFTFNYCNKEDDFPITLLEGNTVGDVDMKNLPKGTMAYVHTTPVKLNMNNLLPGACRNIVATREVNTCWDTIDASLKIEGWRGDTKPGNFCYLWDFYRAYVKRQHPTTSPCQVSASVTCKVQSTGESCDQFAIPIEDCGEETMMFTFIYCNQDNSIIKLLDADTSGTIDMDNLPQGTTAFIGTTAQDLRLDDLYPGQCRTIVRTERVNTCWDAIHASLKIEGWRGDGMKGDYCFAWDYYKQYIRRPNTAPPTKAPSKASRACNVSSKVSCKVDSTGEPCDQFVVPFEDCSREAMTFSFEYCNYEDQTIDLIYGDNTGNNIDMHNLPRGTMAFIFRSPIQVDVRDLPPGTCRTIVVKRDLSTCRPSIEASLKVEGWRGAGEVGDYCFAWNFYKTIINRPDITPTRSPTSKQKCSVSTSITCTVDRTNQPCDKLVVPLQECGGEKMTFTFEYCNEEESEGIQLRLGDTSGDINMKKLPVGTTAFIRTNPVQIDKLYLSPGQCWTIIKTRSLSTCKPQIDASLKIEGWRGDANVGDFCFAWEFYRSIIQRDGSFTLFPSPSLSKEPSSPSAPISTPSTPSTPSQPTVDLCGIPKQDQRAKISAIIDSVSTQADLNNPNSPQSKARDWMLYEDTFDSFCPPPCNRDRTNGGVIQRYVLAVFYFSTNGDDGWLSCGRNSENVCDPTLTLFVGDPVEIISGKSTWLEPISECLWGGLSCRKDTLCIDRIEFEANSVGGQLPTEIEQLNLLRFLYLEGTRNRQEYLSGSLDLIQGTLPSEISTLSNLIILDLNFNLFQGLIPNGVYGMNNLLHLDLDHNQFEGSISSQIEGLKNLRFLQLDHNLFTGQIPKEIGQAKSLINALFHDNNFDGSMPNELCSLLTNGNLTKLSTDCDEVFCSCNCICDGLV